MTSQVPIAQGVWADSADGPRLKGSLCRDCDAHAFPPKSSCQRCAGTNTEPVLLGNRGTLWTFTVQGFAPKPPYIGEATPEKFRPYGVGYVELPGQVKVETRLTQADPKQLHIGMDMKMVLERLATDTAGNDVMTFAFQPVEE